MSNSVKVGYCNFMQLDRQGNCMLNDLSEPSVYVATDEMGAVVFLGSLDTAEKIILNPEEFLDNLDENLSGDEMDIIMAVLRNTNCYEFYEDIVEVPDKLLY